MSRIIYQVTPNLDIVGRVVAPLLKLRLEAPANELLNANAV